MNKLIQGLEILRTYIKQTDLESAIIAEAGGVVIKPTDRQMPYDAVRVMMDLGWKQEDGVELSVGSYNRDKPWIFPLPATFAK